MSETAGRGIEGKGRERPLKSRSARNIVQPAEFIREYYHKTKNPPYVDLRKHYIRVLVLLPDQFNQPLRAKLRHVRLPLNQAKALREACGYEAISYCWGSAEKPHKVHIPGHEAIPITSSLHSALKHFRYTDKSRKLWADAICINQEDISERNTQVAMMADIYELANSVHAWLGPGDESDALAFAAIKACMRLGALGELGDPYTPLWPTVDQVSHSLLQTKYWKAYSQDHPVQDSPIHAACLALYRLTQRPYFTRLWTVQETWEYIAATVTYHSGTFSCKERHIKQATDIFSSLRLSSHAPIWEIQQSAAFIAIRKSWQVHEYDGLTTDLLNVFLQYSMRDCLDPRDRVFALRSVLEMSHMDAIVPDYRLSVSEVHKRFIHSLLELEPGRMIHPSLILALVGTEAPSSRSVEHPSWVADIHHLTPSSREKQFLYSPTPLLSTESGDPEVAPNFAWMFWKNQWSVQISTHLAIRGHVFGYVAERLPLPSLPMAEDNRTALNPEDFSDILVFFDWYASARQLFTRHAMAQTDTVDAELMFFLNYPHKWTVQRGSGIVIDEETSSPARSDAPSDTLATSHSDALSEMYPSYPFTDKLRSWIHWSMLHAGESALTKERQLWRLENEGKSNVAWLPRQCQAGDRICLFAGAPWPFVLRTADNGTFHLVGDGHAHGLALMEAVNGDYILRKTGARTQIPLGLTTERQRLDTLAEQSDWIVLT